MDLTILLQIPIVTYIPRSYGAFLFKDLNHLSYVSCFLIAMQVWMKVRTREGPVKNKAMIDQGVGFFRLPSNME